MKSNGEISLFIGKYKPAVSIILFERKISFKQMWILFLKSAFAFNPKLNSVLFVLQQS